MCVVTRMVLVLLNVRSDQDGFGYVNVRSDQDGFGYVLMYVVTMMVLGTS